MAATQYRIKASQFQETINGILNEFTDESLQASRDAVDATAKRVAEKTQEQASATFPVSGSKRKSTGKYARGWKEKLQNSDGRFRHDRVVYNTNPRLPHLLQNPHAIKNKRGSYGSTPGWDHIPDDSVTEQIFTEEFEKRIGS